jgi:glycine/D-amino acid oxidase-like deaminating enzyme
MSPSSMEPSWGASGRNNGQVIPTLSRPDPDDIVTKHGAAGERFVALLRDSASTLFDIARRYQIQAEQEQSGWVQPVHSPGAHQDRRTAGAAMVETRRAGRTALARADAPDAGLGRLVRRLLEQEWRPHQSARAVAPSCARGAGERGGRIYARSPAIGFERDNGRWVVKTEKGEINGRALIVATNAYTGEFRKR